MKKRQEARGKSIEGRRTKDEGRKETTVFLVPRPSSLVPRLSYFLLLASESGVALLMVLWVMVFLTVIVSEFAHSMRVEINMTRNFKEEAEALSLSEAGINLAFAEILKDSDYIISYTAGSGHEGESYGDVIFVKKGVKDPVENKPMRRGIKLGSGSVGYSISDEDSKININNAARDTIVKLLELSGVEAGELRDTIADSIDDWRDEDSLHRLNGAEEDYYMGLPVPYHCKNGSFDTVEELLLIKGMTADILYGNVVEVKGEDIPDKKPGNGKYTGIYQYLTVIGSGTINFNTAPEILLRIIKGDEEAKNIISKRQGNKGIYDESQKSGTFTILSTGIIGVGGHESPESSPGSGESGAESREGEKSEKGFNKRTVKAICSKYGSGHDARIVIRYWNDNYIPKTG